jgi:cytochrome P450
MMSRMLVSDLDLPAFDYSAPDLTGELYHRRLAEVAEQGWLATAPLSLVVLDRESGEFFLRSRATAFPGRQIADIFGITEGPLREHIDANVLNQNGEHHRRLRALVGPAFTPRAADRWRPVMRDLLKRLWTSATCAVLRYEPITPFTARICTEDLEHRGVTFPAGTIVAICAERANRQPDVPFDITAEREPRLLTFGAGAHYCLGANLARAELEEALTFLAPRMPGLAFDGDPVLGGVEGIYGIDALPLRWS